MQNHLLLDTQMKTALFTLVVIDWLCNSQATPKSTNQSELMVNGGNSRPVVEKLYSALFCRHWIGWKINRLVVIDMLYMQVKRFLCNSSFLGVMAGSPCPIEVMKQVRTKLHMPQVTVSE